ncbi:methyltransferase domain-containing protein [Aeoliella sp. ICT_H6.2]|uniref:Methyltransferase domain-containing protein n=1 Tax=Aeoliella straminimaris TaxID=2954799 RepID=A0A9X2FBF8_9BACT|nr:class I SAM-dependent methyltransferase [Aeoliella straminimaris]MCO6045795.1 methyltransferase domain-containing protein [Aeoliella straminimaris]
MQEIIQDDLYNYPKYYDLVFGSDWGAELAFLQAVFAKHGTGKFQRLLEPGCGTGRLMYRLAQAGFEVAGNDLAEPAVEYCNDRLEKHGFPRTAMVGDMCDFTLSDFKGADFGTKKKFDAAFNMINTFRHLPSEDHARRHLECISAALRKGGLYALGLHLTPTKGEPMDEESWHARRGNLTVLSRLWTVEHNRRKRIERVRMSFDVYTPTRTFRLVNCADFRIYTARQMADLLSSVPSLEVLETYDFAYNIDRPVKIGAETEDVVYILRKK